ncbi:MAG: HAMP domain-containing protein [Anaerolineae bacterium]|nr:HAMP domain-containing protein [Anaerolineae bacterium]
MRGSLFWKLMAAFAVVILVGIGGALLLAGRTTEAEFRRYTRGSDDTGRWEETAADLAGYYAAHTGWDGVEALLRRGYGLGRAGGGGPSLRLADADGRIVADQSGAGEGEMASAGELEAGLPILVDGRRVGTLLRSGGEWLTVEQQACLERMRDTLVISGGAALVVALVLGALLVRPITRPLRQLADASRAVAAGDLSARVSVRSHDEVGQLAAAFNQMTADLSRAEEARRQQTADIAHELRTPLTVIQGHLEALADGIFPAEPEHLDPVLEQARLLARLVEDLRTLSLADAGRLALAPVPTDVGVWVAGVVAGFRPVAADREITLELDVADGLPSVRMDPVRLAQVLGNLLDNGLRHTPAGERVAVSVARQNDTLVVSVIDSGPGVPPEHLRHLFERFWRGDSSRSRRTGGSGLGLAIAQQIVEAHGGRIEAENGPAGGLRVSFSLPVA